MKVHSLLKSLNAIDEEMIAEADRFAVKRREQLKSRQHIFVTEVTAVAAIAIAVAGVFFFSLQPGHTPQKQSGQNGVLLEDTQTKTTAKADEEMKTTAEATSVIRTENKKTTKEQEISSENDEEQDVLWIPAVYQGINTEFGTYYAYETNLIFEISDEEKNLIATNLMCEYMNGRYYLIYDDKVLYYSVEADGMHKIMAYDEKTGMIKEIYSEPYKDSAAEDLVTPNYLYLLGKYSDYLVFMDQSYEQNLQEESGFLVILNLKDKEEIRVRSSYYMEGAYIQAACDKLITSTSDGGYSNLYMIDMKTGEIETISEKCRSTSGDYIKGTDVYYLEKRNGDDQIYHLVCYDLEKEKEDWSIELAGEWYEQNGCFWGNDLQENTYIITYDGVQYPYDGECKSLNRVDGQYVDCTSDGKIRKLNEETGEWEEWIDCPKWLNFDQR